MNIQTAIALRDAKARLQQLEELRRRLDVEILGAEATVKRLAGIKARRRSRFDPPKCGTEAGYQSHRWRFRKHDIGVWPLPEDDPCGCRAAHARYWHDSDATEAQRARRARGSDVA